MSVKVPDLIEKTCFSVQGFKDNCLWVKEIVKNGDGKEVKDVISEIKKIIKDRKHNPLQKMMALDLFHECCMLKNPVYLAFAQEKIMDRFSILATRQPEGIFKDSSKSLENLNNSEKFVQSLLKFIQTWALLPKIRGVDFSVFEKVYKTLKSKVVFPPVEPFNFKDPEFRLAGSRNSAEAQHDSQLFDLLENLLSLIENLEDHSSDTASELIFELKQQRGRFSLILGKVCNQEDPVLIDRVLGINDRIQRIDEMEKKKTGVYVKNRFSTGALVVDKNLEVNKKPFFTAQGLLGANRGETQAADRDFLLVGTGQSAKETGVNLQEKIVKIEEVEKKTEEFSNRNEFKIEESKIEEFKIEESKIKESKIKESKIEENIKPKFDIKLDVPSVQVSSKTPEKPFNIFDDILDLQIEPVSPEKPINKTFNPVFHSPEKTEKYNPFDIVNLLNLGDSQSNFSPFSPFPENTPLKPCLTSRENRKNSSEDEVKSLLLQIEDLKQKNRDLEERLKKAEQSLLLKEKECQENHTVKASVLPDIEALFSPDPGIGSDQADNDYIFKSIVFKDSGTLFENSVFYVRFLVVTQDELIILKCSIVNKSPNNLEKVRLRFVKNGFDVKATPRKTDSIPALGEFLFDIRVKMAAVNVGYPRLRIKYLENEVNLKIPVNFCNFLAIEKK